jgi:hypothetical protein
MARPPRSQTLLWPLFNPWRGHLPLWDNDRSDDDYRLGRRNFTFSGGAVMNLTAPTTGTTAGIALWADRRLTLDSSNSLVGGSTNGIGGAIYLPEPSGEIRR